VRVSAAAVASVGLLLVPLASAASYGRPAEIPLGAQPARVAVSDATQDGLPDILTANASAPAFTLLIGRGEGRFEKPLAIAGPVGARAVVFADFNADGGDDLAVAASDALVIYSGADGTLVRSHSYPAPDPTALVAADFDSDGDFDLAAVTAASSAVAVRLGEGDGTFGAPAQLPITASSFSSLVAADLNGDEAPDLVAGGTTLSILIGLGDGTFEPSRGTPGFAGMRAVAADDLDADGDADLFAAGGSNTAGVALNDGEGTFSSFATYRVGGTPAGVALDDVDADGSVDILTVNRGTNDVSVLAGRGDGAFAAETRIRVGRAPAALRADDLNGDGANDLVVANGVSKSVTVLLTGADAPQPTVCLVPRVVRRKLAVARGLVARAHCTVSRVQRKYSRRVRRNRVIAQAPVPGARAPEGTPVALVVSRGPRR
jgi:FG-GAP-like repeat